MSYSATQTATETFTITHAKHIAAKVATDLLRLNRFYGRPTIAEINDYETELTALIRYDYLDKVVYGYTRDAMWVEALMYRALSDGTLIADDDPGKLRPVENVPTGAFSSFVWWSSKYSQLSQDAKNSFYADLPFRRTDGPERQLESGYWSSDLNYSAGGRGIGRSTIIR